MQNMFLTIGCSLKGSGAVGTAVTCIFYLNIRLGPTPKANPASSPIFLEPTLSQMSRQESKFEQKFLQCVSGHLPKRHNEDGADYMCGDCHQKAIPETAVF